MPEGQVRGLDANMVWGGFLSPSSGRHCEAMLRMDGHLLPEGEGFLSRFYKFGSCSSWLLAHNSAAAPYRGRDLVLRPRAVQPLRRDLSSLNDRFRS